MQFNTKNILEKLRQGVHKPAAPFILGGLFFAETFLFIPLDPILMFYVSERKDRLALFVAIATLCSVLGGLCAYFLGSTLWNIIGKKLVATLLSPSKFEQAISWYAHYHHWTVFFGALLPIPFKLITLSAGFCHLPLIPFVAAMTAGRGLRFSIVSLISYSFAGHVSELTKNYSKELVFIGLIKLIIVAGIIIKFILSS